MTSRYAVGRIVAWFLMAALCSVAADPVPAARAFPAGEPGAASGDSSRVILILGSSTAAGAGATTPESSWVGRFRTFVKRNDPTARIVNLAVGGYTTYDIMPSRYQPPSHRPAPKPDNNITYGLTFNPRCVIINLPSNDAANGYPLSESLANYDTVLSRIPAGVQVWVTTTQPRNLDVTGRAALLALRDSTRARSGTHALDFWRTLANPDGTLKKEYDAGDGIHLNDAGHRILAERVIASRLWSGLPPGPGK